MFNTFLLDGVFYACRTILHAKLSLENSPYILLSYISMLLVVMDLQVMGYTLLWMMKEADNYKSEVEYKEKMEKMKITNLMKAF